MGMPDAVAPLTVADVLLRIPKTHGLGLTVLQAREALADDHVHMLLLTEDGVLHGTLVRSDLEGPLDPGRSALGLATLAQRTVDPAAPLEDVVSLMDQSGTRRLAVTDSDNRLLGLLCRKRSLRGFCTEANVRSRTSASG
ncbi:CBS domain-containing protein [Nocardioides sp.]|uniref:CBS domain-containing protein n=1 Tax=Nocardioides sp. TaxID=35761 RepID=UPI003D0F0677